MAFPCFQSLYVTLAVDKMDGHGYINTARHEHLPKKTKVTQNYLQKDYPKDRAWLSALVIKVSGQMRSDAFKRRLTFSFTVINFGLKQLSKCFFTKALGYKAILKFKNSLHALLHIS